VGTGTATITASFSGFTATATITNGGQTLQSIAVTPATSTMLVGQKKQMHATATFSDGSTLDVTTQCTWSSSDTTIATIGSNAVLTATGLGTATITATKSGVSGTATVNVTPPQLQSITVTPVNAWSSVGQTTTYTAMGKFNDGTTQDITATATWSSSNTAVATMSANVATGAVTATQASLTGSTTLTITQTALVSIAVTPTTANVAAGYKVQFVATGTFMDGSTKNLTSSVLWASSDTSVATESNLNGSRGIALEQPVSPRRWLA
jgi:hypothetical protein